ncbi:MAG: carbohydrate kinase [Bacteroidetes bacterium]|nr:carbohydrate kinase [Bacteroidota bacterium]
MNSTLSAKQIKSIFTKFNRLKVFVIGDAMLDNYWFGNIERISPEAPVPIVSVSKKESRPGGAANVALNCKSLGAKVSLLSVIGQDANGKKLIQQLQEAGIETDKILQSKTRVTTTKSRIICKNQHVIRLDEETESELEVKDEHHFIDTCLRAIQIEAPDIVIFEDYNKGVLKANVIHRMMEHCQHLGCITAVDPKKINFLAYSGATIFKPNLKEIREGLHIELDKISLAEMKKVHQSLNEKLHHQITLVTLSEKGIFVQGKNECKLFPAHIRNIADVSGAGDTVIATAAMVYCITKDISLMAQISNLAGGLVCEEVGVVPILKDKLLQESIGLLSN